ncbi:MAG: helix-turn-helix domain-containing protein [Candidatus Binatus sp.]|uniref:helix-turn-helix domain-containing protein n=1 Tax=Candidatus Binatus sp. TaxID=2811406 RepID=UPI0027190CAC|nr:helix-turn-helix domain-containing protein [Candidatus Binatus sp.]MDO8432697.1 helix-turn-helix domain-containing protein [Candidatus Binatus sp.]
MERYPEILTVTQLAEYLQCDKSTIYRLIKSGEIPAFRVGSNWRFRREVIAQWLEQRSRPKKNGS